MRLFVKENRVLLAIIGVAFIVALVVIGGRMSVEHKNKTYDVVLDYQELHNMVEQSDHSMDWWLKEFKSMGINKVGLQEESLDSLTEGTRMPISAKMMSDVMKDANWKQKYDPDFIQKLEARSFDDFDVLVEARSQDSYDFIADAMQERYHDKQYLLCPFSDGKPGGYIVLYGTAKEALYSPKTKEMDSRGVGFADKDVIVGSKLMSLSLGLLPERVHEIENAGMEVVPRTSSYSGWNDTRYAKAVLAGYQKLAAPPTYMIVAGESVIGYDDGQKGVNWLSSYIEKNHVHISLIENTTQRQNILQKGLNAVVKKSGYDAVRVFSVWDYIQNRYKYYGYSGAQEIENTLFRAITERNIRLVYYKPIKEFKDNHVYITNPKVYEEMFRNLNSRLAEHGISMSHEASVMSPYQVSMAAKIIMSIGLAAALALLLQTIFPIRKKYIYGLFGVAALLAVAGYLLAPNLALKAAPFAAAVLFPCLAIAMVIRTCKDRFDHAPKDQGMGKIIGLGALALIGAVATSLVGGIMVAAPISSINYLLEIDIFRGVKVAQLLPLAFFLLLYLAYFGFGSQKKTPGRLEAKDLRDMLNADIKIWMVLLCAVIGAVGMYYISRTGNDSAIPPSTMEMLMRNALEDHLLARPRSKEFLFAFPCMFLLIYSSVRKLRLWPIIFGLSTVIGLTSVCNTFMHIRTPMYLGLTRTGYSLLFGLILGVVAVVVFDLIYKGYRVLHQRLFA